MYRGKLISLWISPQKQKQQKPKQISGFQLVKKLCIANETAKNIKKTTDGMGENI